jgi:hypothetical protein
VPNVLLPKPPASSQSIERGGISRRMVAYYEQGAKPIPHVIALATRALALA